METLLRQLLQDEEKIGPGILLAGRRVKLGRVPLHSADAELIYMEYVTKDSDGNPATLGKCYVPLNILRPMTPREIQASAAWRADD